MGQISQELIETVLTLPGDARLSQILVESALTPTDSARISQVFVEPTLFAVQESRVSQMFVEAFFREIPEPPGVYGVWPQEYNKVLPAIQGQRLKAGRGQR